MPAGGNTLGLDFGAQSAAVGGVLATTQMKDASIKVGHPQYRSVGQSYDIWGKLPADSGKTRTLHRERLTPFQTRRG